MGPRAFQRAFETHRDPVFRFLLRLCRVRSEAEDLLQDTFVAFWRKRDTRPRDDAKLRAWLRRIAFRLYVNRYRRTTRRAGLAQGFRPPSRPALDADAVAEREESSVRLAAVRRAVDELSDGHREVFVLHRFEGLSCPEIADLMGVPLKTVESRLLRGTRRIADRIRRHAPEVPSR